jgi:hypothetical protein
MFSVAATRSDHQDLLNRLHQTPDLRDMDATPGAEVE